jgi:hypothetical protein
MRRPTQLAAIGVAGMLALAGCGGGHASAGASKSSYVAKANAICAQTRTQTTPLINRISANLASLVTGGASGARQIAATVSRLSGVATRELTRLGALSQPSGDHAAIARFVSPLRSIVSALSRAARALSTGQAPQALSILQAAQPLAAEVTSAAQALGLAKCESVLSALG